MKSAPRYLQINQYYQNLITSQQLVEGEQLPTEDDICKLFSVSRITTRQALDKLTQEGYIYKIQGKGSFVSSRKTDLQLNRLMGFSDEMKQLGREASTQLISHELVEASELVANALQLVAGQNIYRLVRLRLGDDVPMALEHVYLPFFRFPGLLSEDLTKSLYKLLDSKYGCRPHWARQSIQAGVSTAKEAAVLLMQASAPVLRISRTTYEANGVACEHVESVYPGDKYILNVNLSP